MDSKTKICAKCQISKNLDDFTSSMINRASGWCKSCISQFDREKIAENKKKSEGKTYKICPVCKQEKIRSEFSESKFIDDTKKGRCRECEKENNKKYKSSKDSYMKKYYEENKEEILVKKKTYNQEHKEAKKEYDIEYRKNNVDKINNRIREWVKNKRENDLEYRIKITVSAYIRCYLRKQLSSKNNDRTWEFLPYSPNELISHLEKQFSSIENLDYDGRIWMNWENWGRHDSELFNINDSSTWTWNIDHIVPNSRFKYDNLKHPELQKAWALENLRPYRSDLNIKDGARRNE